MRFLAIPFKGKVGFGAWGRNGVIQQSGLHVQLEDDEIVLQPITSKGGVSTACSIRVPLVDRDAVVKALKALS